MQKNLLEWKSEYENKEVEKHKREIAQAVLRLTFILVLHIFVVSLSNSPTAAYIIGGFCGIYYGLEGYSIVRKIRYKDILFLKTSKLLDPAVQEYKTLCRFFNASRKTIMGNTIYFVFDDELNQCFVEEKLPGGKTKDLFRKGIDMPQVDFTFFKDDNGLPHYEYNVYKPYEDVEKHYF